jgi:hypothetical protein
MPGMPKALATQSKPILFGGQPLRPGTAGCDLTEHATALSWHWGNLSMYRFTHNGIIKTPVITRDFVYSEIFVEFGIIVAAIVLRNASALAAVVAIMLAGVVIVRSSRSISWPLSRVLIWRRIRRIESLSEEQILRLQSTKMMSWSEIKTMDVKGRTLKISMKTSAFQATINKNDLQKFLEITMPVRERLVSN